MAKIIGIDPGNEKSAIVIWDGEKIIAKAKTENYILLNQIRHYPKNDAVMAIEMLASYGMPVGQTVLDTCKWVGRFQEAWESKDLGYKCELLFRKKDICMNLCNSTRAKDKNIRQALIDRFGKPGTKKNPNLIYDDMEIKMADDIWQALAVAITYQDLYIK